MNIKMYICSTVAKQHSIADARMHLPTLVREAESGRAVELTRRGEAVAVLIGRQEYDRLTARRRSFSEAWKTFSREVDLADLNLDPDEIFSRVRDTEPGRDPKLGA